MRVNTKFNLRAASALMLCLALYLLSACASKNTKTGLTRTPDNEPTLKSLAGRTVKVEKDKGVVTSEAQAIKAYRSFLDTAPKAAKISNAPLRAEAMRRIGDLEMDSADNMSESPQVTNAPGSAQDNGPDYRTAVARYQEFLNTYPNDPNNDRVLYQLARAQEQNGDLESALKTLDRLVKGYPDTAYNDEAQFRRGELLFTTRDYVTAEQAYTKVLRSGTTGRYHDRALYMRGWSQFKQGKLDDALQSFFAVLDIMHENKLADKDGDAGLETIAGLSRAERELVEDTFRVTSICLANLQGADSISAYINSPTRDTYEFRVYQQLGELYLKQERVKDAADTFSQFARRKPLDAQAPVLQARVIEIYQGNGFATLALEAKKEYVVRYGSKSEFRRANPDGWMKAQTLVKTHVAELARHYHASAQKSKNTADYQEAVHWYREYLASFPSDPQAAQNNFLLAELLFEDGHFSEASVEYEKTAYAYPVHGKSADAGYSALLSYAKQLADAAQLPAQLSTLQKASVASAIRFAQSFSTDPRAAAVLANAAEKLYALKDNEQAATLAQKLLDLQPAAADDQRRVAWTIIAYTAFERSAFAPAELAFAEVLKLTASGAASRNELVERLAASIYQQGEQARNAGQLREAVRHFERIAHVAPASPVRATAQYDAAATLMSLKDWPAAARTLEDFRSRYPNNPLQADVGYKLAVVYIENAQWESAAKELERLAASNKDAKGASDMLWRAAELYEKAGSRAAAKKTYERYLTLPALNLEAAIEARFRLAGIAKEEGNGAREFALMKEIFLADQNGGTGRTERTRYLAATAALAIAEPVAEAYRKIALIEPLQKNLKLKKAKMEEALKAYAAATDLGVADISTAATFRIASIYRDFGKALMASERPKKLNKIEREQYNVLLEEQAFPFEEKAIEVHSINAQRSATGIYDKWVKNSFDALRELQPVRYGKTERAETVVDTSSTALKEAATQNQLGIKLRQAGKFEQAREAYELAIKLDTNYAPAILNLGILHDMYLADGKRALNLYARYLALTPAGDGEVNKWIAELKNRKPNPAVAQKEKS